jgi:GNAT superfamily N-acetyltransferase
MIKIRKIEATEINLLKDFPPEDWKMDLPALISMHHSNACFYPVAAESGEMIIGCGIAYCFGKTGWLGNIIVIPDFRRQGIGRSITMHLMDYLREKGCNTQILIATEMGENIYRNLGFRISSMYDFYRCDSAVAAYKFPGIRKMEKGDIPAVEKIDRMITGETRSGFLEKYYSGGWVYERRSRGIGGFYLPDFSNGPVEAEETEIGLELMMFRLAHGRLTAAIPEENRAAGEFLVSLKFRKYRTAPRMVFGPEVPWQPEKIFNRGSGYCG